MARAASSPPKYTGRPYKNKWNFSFFVGNPLEKAFQSFLPFLENLGLEDKGKSFLRSKSPPLRFYSSCGREGEREEIFLPLSRIQSILEERLRRLHWPLPPPPPPSLFPNFTGARFRIEPIKRKGKGGRGGWKREIRKKDGGGEEGKKGGRVEWCREKKLRHKTRTWISPTVSRPFESFQLMDMCS